MKKYFVFFAILGIFGVSSITYAKDTTWKATPPPDYTAITWIKTRGVETYVKAPEANGYLDYLTYIYLPYNQIKLVASSSPRQDWGQGKTPFDSDTVHDWAFAKMQVEKSKKTNPDARFMWNVPFFNVTIPTTDLSLSLKSTDASSTYITSGSRPEFDTAQDRRMLIIDNKAGTATISDFDAPTFMAQGDQAVEGFAPTVTSKGTDVGTARLFLGVKPGGKELIVYCTQGASPSQASQILQDAGVPLENQLQADGGTSVTCAYNLPGQYFVEPGRTLPHLMAAFPILYRATITLDTLNIRSGPGTKYSIAGSFNKNDIISVYEEKNGWLRTGNNEWILGKYAKKKAF